MVLKNVVSPSSASMDRSEWQSGEFTVIAQYVGGTTSILAISLGVSAAVGGWGLYVTEMMEDSFQIQVFDC